MKMLKKLIGEPKFISIYGMEEPLATGWRHISSRVKPQIMSCARKYCIEDAISVLDKMFLMNTKHSFGKSKRRNKLYATKLQNLLVRPQ